MLDNVLGNSGKLGGPNKTAQVGESKFGRRKYNRGLKVKGQWVFSVVECDSGKDISSSLSGENYRHVDGCSSLLDRTGQYSHQGFLVGIQGQEGHGYTHKTVYHTIGFCDVRTAAHRP